MIKMSKSQYFAVLGRAGHWSFEIRSWVRTRNPIICICNDQHGQKVPRLFPGKHGKTRQHAIGLCPKMGYTVYCQIAHFNKEHDDESMVFEVFPSFFHRFLIDFSQISRALWVPGPKPGFPLLWPEVFQTLEERGGPEMCGDRQAVPMGPMASEIAGKMDGTWDNMDN